MQDFPDKPTINLLTNDIQVTYTKDRSYKPELIKMTPKDLQPNMETMRLAKNGNEEAQRVMYLEYVNNFLTVAGFSRYYGIGQSSGEVYLKDWRNVHENFCAELKRTRA